jgi:hypothetical protein
LGDIPSAFLDAFSRGEVRLDVGPVRARGLTPRRPRFLGEPRIKEDNSMTRRMIALAVSVGFVATLAAADDPALREKAK